MPTQPNRDPYPASDLTLDGLKSKCMALKHGRDEGAVATGVDRVADGVDATLRSLNGSKLSNRSSGADFLANMSTCMLTQGAPANRIDTDTHLRYAL